MKGKKSEVLTEGTPGTVVEGGKVISSDAPGNTSFFGSLFGGQSSKPFQNRRALGLADILTFDRFDFDKRIEAFEKGEGKDFMKEKIPYGMTIDPSTSIFSNIAGYEEFMKDKNLANIFKGNKDNKETKVTTDDKTNPPKFQDIFDMTFEDYLNKVAGIGEKAKDRDALRSGISNLAYSPLIGSQAAMDAAANISNLTGVNMAAIANQGDVMAQNPTKQKIAGRYFR